MSINQRQLNKLTSEAAELLARTLPANLAGITQDERDGYCELALANPFRSDEPLRISTQNAEITLQFGQCHTHFSDHHGTQREADLVGQMVVKIAGISCGSEVSYSAWAGERCLGGGWLAGNGDGHEQLSFFPQADRLQVVAWEPWHDREIRRGD